MAATLRSDPLRNFKFQVEIGAVANNAQTGTPMHLNKLGFMSCSGLSMTTEMIPYREGGMNTVTRKMPGQSDYPPVTFQRGLFVGQSQLFDWFKDIFFIDSIGSDATHDWRCNVNIRVLPHPSTEYPGLTDTGGGGNVTPTTGVNQKRGQGKQVFRLINAWPTSLSWSDLDAGGNGIIMEQMTLVHEGLIPAYAQSKDGNAYWNIPLAGIAT